MTDFVAVEKRKWVPPTTMQRQTIFIPGTELRDLSSYFFNAG